MVEPRGSEKVRRPKFLVSVHRQTVLSLFSSPSRSSVSVSFVFVLLFGWLLYFAAVHLLSDRLSFVGLHVTRFPAATPQFTTSLCIPAFSISSIFSGIRFFQISFYYRPSINYFRPAMTEVSSTRLYLGNLPRNGMLTPDLSLFPELWRWRTHAPPCMIWSLHWSPVSRVL